MRFLAVKHEWFNDSYGFDVREIEADTREDAEDKAKAWQARANDKASMHHHAVTLIAPTYYIPQADTDHE